MGVVIELAEMDVVLCNLNLRDVKLILTVAVFAILD